MPIRGTWIRTVTVCSAAFLFAGCTSSSQNPQTSATPSGTPSVGVSATPAATATSPTSRPAPDLAALQRKATAATIAPDGLIDFGGARKPKTDEKGTFATTEMCGKRVVADSGQEHASHNRTWAATGLWVRNTTHAYASTTGAAVVRQVKAAAETCKKYTFSLGQSTILGPVKLPDYPGVEGGYGLCQRIVTTDSDYIACEAYLAKGNVVSSVMVLRGSSRETNSEGLRIIGSVAAAALSEIV